MSGMDDREVLTHVALTPEQRADAAAYCVRRGAEDVLGMLGLARDVDSEGAEAPQSDERPTSGCGDAATSAGLSGGEGR